MEAGTSSRSFAIARESTGEFSLRGKRWLAAILTPKPDGPKSRRKVGADVSWSRCKPKKLNSSPLDHILWYFYIKDTLYCGLTTRC
jgi:hypothetical protein